MSNTEKLIITLCVGILTILCTYASQKRWYTGQMDNLLPVSIIENIYNKGVAEFPEVGLREALSLAEKPPDIFCEADLLLPVREFDSMYNWHTYLFLYAIAPFQIFFSSVTIVAFFTVISVMLLLSTTYASLRNSGVSILTTILFLLLVISHPGINNSLIGQFYPDRFLLGSLSLLIFQLTKKDKSRTAILLTVFLCASINDRIGLICGAFIFAYVILYFKETTVIRNFLLTTACLVITFSIIAIKFVIQNQYYGSFGDNFTYHKLIANFSDTVFTAHLYRFLLVNFLLFGIFSVCNIRALLICLGLMIPNIFGSIAGAEKTGWATHYHAMYLPVLVWASASGFSYLYSVLSKRRMLLLLQTFIVANILLLCTYAPNPPSIHAVSIHNFTQHVFFQYYHEVKSYFDNNSLASLYLDIRKDIISVTEPGKVISVTEHGMPMMYGHGRLAFFPVGLAQADYLLISYERAHDGKIKYGGYVSYFSLTPDQKNKVDGCLQKKMIDAGFDLDNPILHYASFALIKKKVQSAH